MWEANGMSGSVRCQGIRHGLPNHGGSGGVLGAPLVHATGSSVSGGFAVGARSMGFACWTRDMTGRKPFIPGDVQKKATSSAGVRATLPHHFERAALHALSAAVENRALESSPTMTKPNKKTAWVEDLCSVFEVCARDTPPGKFQELPRSDVAGNLPHLTGRGHIPCSMAAVRRVRQLADLALSNSDAVGTLEPERVHSAFRNVIVDRFIKEQSPIDERNVEKAMATAVNIARRDRADTVHYVPCREA